MIQMRVSNGADERRQVSMLGQRRSRSGPLRALLGGSIAVLLGLAVAITAGTALAQGGGGGQTPVDTWDVDAGGSTTAIDNNQVAGNYKVKNGPGTSTVTVTVKNEEGEVVAGPIDLDPGETSPQLGVPLGGDVEIVDDGGTKGASGKIWKFS